MYVGRDRNPSGSHRDPTLAKTRCIGRAQDSHNAVVVWSWRSWQLRGHLATGFWSKSSILLAPDRPTGQLARGGFSVNISPPSRLGRVDVSIKAVQLLPRPWAFFGTELGRT